MRAPTELRTAVYDRAEQVDARQWSRLAGDAEARLDRPWFLYFRPEAERAYVTVWRDESLCGLAPCLIWAQPEGFSSQRPMDVLLAPAHVRGPDEPGLDRSVLNRTAVGLHAFRYAASVSVVSVGTRFARVSDLLAAADGSAELAINELDSLALSHGAELWAILGVAETSSLLVDAARLGFIPALVTANTVLEVPPSFDDYLATLPRHRRGIVRHELRAPAEREIVITEERDVPAIADELNALVAAHRARYGWPEPYGVPIGFERLLQLYGDDMWVMGARRNGRLVAFAFSISRGRAHTYVGYFADQALIDPSDFMFPNAFYAFVRRIAAVGGGVAQFGATNYRAKLLRGCRLERIWGLYRPLVDELREPLAAHAAALNQLQAAHFGALAAFE
jgi:peptidoglycan biosynthesis/recognition FemAB-like protein